MTAPVTRSAASDRTADRAARCRRCAGARRTAGARRWRRNAPAPCRSSATPVCRKAKISCMVIMSPSMPVISCTLTTFRRPSVRRATCSTTESAELICWRLAFGGRFMPAMPIMFSSRVSASRGALAWIVVIDPSWPVFIACSMSTASAPRTSPRMMRSGRIRSALRTSARWVTSPLPSMLGGRVSRRTTCGCCSWSSAASSMVMIALLRRDVAGQDVEQRRLAAARAAGDQDVDLGLGQAPGAPRPSPR